jgi:hypothetical protein
VNTFCRVSKPQPCRLQGLRFQSLAGCGRSSSTMQCNSISNSITELMKTFHLFLSAISGLESLYKNRPRFSAPLKELCGLTFCTYLVLCMNARHRGNARVSIVLKCFGMARTHLKNHPVPQCLHSVPAGTQRPIKPSNPVHILPILRLLLLPHRIHIIPNHFLLFRRPKPAKS